MVERKFEVKSEAGNAVDAPIAVAGKVWKQSWLGKAHWATTLEARLAGLLGSRHGKHPLALAPCRDIHTFGMTRVIDVAFIDKNGRVLASRWSVGAAQMMKVRQAAIVVERQSDDEKPWPKVGDSLVLGFEEGRNEDVSDLRIEGI